MARAKNRPPQPQLDWAYFLDMDGTLIDIAAMPDAIEVDNALLGLVARLHDASGGALALVSGRTVADLEQRLGGVRIPLAGQHGLERRSAAGMLQAHPRRADCPDDLRRSLEGAVARHPGLLLEDKGGTLAIHYRQAPRLAGYVHRLVRDAMAPLADRLCLQKGKRVVEIRPCGCDKGGAIEQFMAEAPFRGRFPVFIGDDVTDEHGFAVINRLGGLSVKVGPGPTVARWRLPDVRAVRRWLASAVADEGARRMRA